MEPKIIRTLARRSLFWIGALDGISNVGIDDGRLSLIARGHFATLALEHLGTCCELLQEHASAELRGLMRAFTACWEQDAPLRNVLEHEEEYIRGGGRQRNVFDPAHLDDPPVRAASAAIPRPLMSFEIYGRTLDFGPHTARANAMKQLLLEWESALGAPPG